MDYAWPIYDCEACGCRFTRHDSTVYEKLHSEAGSCYTRYRDLLARCQTHFERRDLGALRAELCETSKYRFVIEELEKLPRDARILEMGCSRGHLAAYAILAGRTILAVDVSRDALDAATSAFGPHFALADSAAIQNGAPYDMIYHVGTIGCVAGPIGMTRELLELLKPGGRLLFNAPNRQACYYLRQLWFDSAPPPDVVTLFPPGFWNKSFDNLAQVEESVETHGADQNMRIGLRKLFRRGWHHPEPLPLSESSQSSAIRHHQSQRLWSFFERSMVKVGRLTGLNRLAPAQPTEYGLFVNMTRRSSSTIPMSSRSP